MGHQAKTWLAAVSALCFILWGGVKAAHPAWAAGTAGEMAAAAGAGMAVVPYKTLTWDDFRVDDSVQGLAAETGTALSFRYRMQVEQAPQNAVYTATSGETRAAPFTVHISGITFSGGFDRAHSWRRSKVMSHPDAGRLLLHEQGHFDIAEIERRRLEATPLSTLPAGHGQTMSEAVDDLRSRMTAWFQAQTIRIKNRQLQYDAETENSTKKNAQQAWNELLTREIMGAVPAPVTMMASR